MLDIEADAPLSPEDAAHTARILTLAESLGVDPCDLDDAVHDAASRYASEAANSTDDGTDTDELHDEAGRQAAEHVNNQGLGRQVAYLVAQCGHEEAERIVRETV
ncbi:hypothetical protein [Streptomyces marianii]|uniref:Uncharacterized protein n=1 Tax=Streptomyces marianii TaxID=1817406 RepID=A0A5R9DWG5_9ACTN|nr:hypothetical protein [Streptomyces marianii]TLQ39212.1 hypothetical protein FEF34_38080 [Streptomyces marianii]